MLTPGAATYGELRSSFRWQMPERYNLGVDVSDRLPTESVAIISTDGCEVTRRTTFGELSELSNRLANALQALGVRRGDRVGIVLTQRVETAVAHIAVYKLGAIAVPLSVLFGPEALRVRLGDADPRVVIAEHEALETVRELDIVPTVVDADRQFDDLVTAGSARFQVAETDPDTPALIIYTSGTTGPPKGALHAHRILYGHLPGIELSHDFLPAAGDLMWTPADWAWIGGLYDVLMPALHHGVPVVAFRAPRFDPEQVADVITRLEVRNLFLPPTALRLMRQTDGAPVRVRTVASGGESLNADLLEWGRSRFGVTINEFYGQTEANVVVSNCSALWPVRPGSMGRAVPGHHVAVLDGEICVAAAGDPVVFLGYWHNDRATAAKVREGWLRTGDLGQMNEDGSIEFLSRADDVINSGGYRIGPGEIESCLLRHPSVAAAAVVGIPDAVRGELVKAFVVPARGAVRSSELAGELRRFVRERLAAYEYPRLIEFLDELPLTTTGKIQRAVLRARETTGSKHDET